MLAAHCDFIHVNLDLFYFAQTDRIITFLNPNYLEFLQNVFFPQYSEINNYFMCSLKVKKINS